MFCITTSGKGPRNRFAFRYFNKINLPKISWALRTCPSAISSFGTFLLSLAFMCIVRKQGWDKEKILRNTLINKFCVTFQNNFILYNQLNSLSVHFYFKCGEAEIIMIFFKIIFDFVIIWIIESFKYICIFSIVAEFNFF